MRTSSSFRGRISRRYQGVLTTGLILLVQGAAFAQSAPPTPSLKNTPPKWIGFLVIFILAVIVVAVSLIPSKRGHQD